LTERLTAQADFLKCANETVSVARDLYPQDASIANRVAKAWADVGVLSAPGAAVAAIALAPTAAQESAARPAAAIAETARPHRRKSKKG
jgi:thermolysin metallopeptidase-like protein